MKAEIKLRGGTFPDPESRARPGCRGIPVVLDGGSTWLLHPGHLGQLGALDAIRDKLFDDSTLSARVIVGDACSAASLLLLANYDLTEAESWTLLIGLDDEGRKRLVEAVMEAFFGPDKPRRSYSAWATSALIANNIDPSSVPVELLGPVLDHLVASGRAMPQDRCVDSVEAARKVAGIQALIDSQAAERAAREDAPPPVVISGPGAHPEPGTP